MRALLVALLLLPCAVHAQAGRFLLAVGEVAVVRAGGEFKPVAGTPIQPGDLIRLGSRSNAQIRLSDESIVALRAGTELRIDAYTYTGNAEENRSFFSLLRGGLRTVTGAIGALRERERYWVKTPTATIGIRGTHYVLLHCESDCGAGAQTGTYGGVSDGRIGVENETGERQFGAQEFFHVASAGAVPQGLIAPPAFLYDRLEGQERSRGRQGAETSENMARSGLDAESRPSDVPTPPEPPAFVVTEQRDEAGNPIVITTLATGGGIAFSSPDIADLQESTSQSITLDATGTRMEAFAATNAFGDSVSAARGAASFADTGANASGDVFWGRWTPGASASVLLGDDPTGIPQQVTPATGIHWIFGAATAPAVIGAKTGTVPYAYAGGTNPTDGSGTPGTMDAANSAFSVDFTARSVSGNLAYTVGGVDYDIPVSAALQVLGNKAIFADVRDGPDVIGTCSACGGFIDLTSVGGMFYGASGAGLGVTFATEDASAGVSAGAAFFGAAPPPLPPALGFAFSDVAHDVGDVHGTQASLSLDSSGTLLESASGTECISGPCNTYALSRNGASFLDTGGDSSVAAVRWGRWTSGASWTHPADGTITPPTGIHWIFGDVARHETVAARTGTVVYTRVGGTNPTDAAGNIGTMRDSSFSVDLVGRLVTGAVNYALAGANYNVGVPGVPIVASNGQAIFAYNALDVGGFCDLCDQPVGSYSIGGTFMGSQGDGLAVTWATHHGIVGQTAGAGYFAATSVPTPTTALVLALTHPSGTRDDPAAFAVPSNLTTAGAGTSRTLQAFTVPSFAHIDLTAGGLSGTGGSITNETAAGSLDAYWGRWAGGSLTDSFGGTSFSAANQLHYIVAPLTPDTVVAAKTGSFAFNLVGGTTPTNNIGETASSFSVGPLSVDFTARTVSWPVTTFNFPSQNWSFPTTTSGIHIDAGRGAFTDNGITGTCGPLTGCDGSARLVRTGVFMGPAGEHLGVSFQARTTSGPAASMQSSGIFQQQ